MITKKISLDLQPLPYKEGVKLCSLEVINLFLN